VADERTSGSGSGPEPDPFDNLVLDEAFIAAARHYEPPARTRAAIQKYSHLERSTRSAVEVHPPRPEPAAPAEPNKRTRWRWAGFASAVIMIAAAVAVVLNAKPGTPGSSVVPRQYTCSSIACGKSFAGDWSSLRTGDCMNVSPRATEIDFAIKPCSGPHEYEVYYDGLAGPHPPVKHETIEQILSYDCPHTWLASYAPGYAAKDPDSSLESDAWGHQQTYVCALKPLLSTGSIRTYVPASTIIDRAPKAPPPVP
jgi:hypothetical protein